MASLEQSIELYKLMAKRCDASEFTKNQSKIYSEMVEFIQSCDSLEDSMTKIKNLLQFMENDMGYSFDDLMNDEGIKIWMFEDFNYCVINTNCIH